MKSAAILLCACLLASAQAPGAEGYEITVNDVAVEPVPFSPFLPECPAVEGDVVRIGGFLITLGPPGTYRFLDRGDRLVQVDEKGGETIVAIGIFGLKESEDGEPIRVNPLSWMTRSQIGCLRGVRICPFEGEGFEGLEHLDPEKVVVHICETLGTGAKKLPSLPAGLRYLVVDLHYNLRFGFSEIEDFSSLSSLTDLRYLVSEGPSSTFDLALIKECAHLRHLNLHGGKIENPKLLASFPELDTLCLRWGAVRDLSAIAKLPLLRRLHLEYSRVRELPPVALPALRELHTTGSEMTDEAVADFLARNPRCESFRGFGRLLGDALSGATRIRVSDGGDVFEMTGPEAAEFLVGIRLHEKACDDQWYPLASGDVRLELFRGAEPAGTFALRDGCWIDWPERLPGTARLTGESADLVCERLAAGGIKRPLAEWEDLKRSRGPEFRRFRRYDPHLPEFLYRFCLHGDTSRLGLEFQTWFPNPAQRAYVAFRLLGIDEGSWNLDCGLDALLVLEVLPAIKKREISRAIAKVEGDPLALSGAGRWLFGEGKLGGVDRKAMRKALEPIARRALAHPRRINRQRTMIALSRLGGRTAKGLLKEVAEGKISVRPLPREEARETEDRALWQESLPDESEIGDREFAKKLLEETKR